MANFEVKVQPIFIKDHPNAERLDIGNVGHPDGHQVVVAKGRLKTGDLVAYIGENGVVPEWVLKHYGYWDAEKNKGLLAGSKGDRVKAVKLRDAFSLGIVLPVVHLHDDWYCFPHEEDYENKSCQDVEWAFKIGEDVSEALGVTKYEPAIPVHMSGEVYNAGTEITLNYDIENSKNWPDIFSEGEDVVFTEKIHGTYCQISYIPINSPFRSADHLLVDVENPDGIISGQFAVSSKGLGAQGLCFKWNDANSGNLYQRVVRKYFEKILITIDELSLQNSVIILSGEVFGNGVQDLQYGKKQNEVDFRMFDIYVGQRGFGCFVNDTQLDEWAALLSIPRVPILYRGPFNYEKIQSLIQNQKSTFDANQIIEGGVLKPVKERRHPDLGRVALKYINEKYLLRKNATELS